MTETTSQNRRREVEQAILRANDAANAAATAAIAALEQPDQSEAFRTATAEADRLREELATMDRADSARRALDEAKVTLGAAAQRALAEDPEAPVLPRVRAELANVEAARRLFEIAGAPDREVRA